MRAHVYVSGLVQGVGFRYFTANKAAEYGITGWVKNLKDGRVEAEFQKFTLAANEFIQKAADERDKKNIEEMIEACRSGPTVSAVNKVEVKWEEEDDDLLTEFEIR